MCKDYKIDEFYNWEINLRKKKSATLLKFYFNNYFIKSKTKCISRT